MRQNWKTLNDSIRCSAALAEQARPLQTLAAGCGVGARGKIAQDNDPHSLARLWYAALQGALVVSRAGNHEILRDALGSLKNLTLRGA
jgi:hypothetical protein